MKQKYRSNTKSYAWIFLSILLFGFSIQKTQGQSNKIYANSPDGRTYYELSDSKMLIKFQENASFESIQTTLQKEKYLKRVTKTMVLPSPKNAVLAEITKPLSAQEYNAILKRLEQESSVVYAHAFLKHEDGTLQGITDRIAVKLKSTGDYAKLDAMIRENGLKLVEKNKYDPLVFFVQVPKTSINPLVLANQLAENGQFAWVEVDFMRLMNRFNTNDTFLANQWSLNNTGSAIQNNGTPGADMRVFNAWGISTGSSNIKVAILDEGVDLAHPDLQANMLGGFDGTGLNSGGAPSGNDAHGTACAGIVAAVGNNNLGIAGVAYGSKIIPVRIAYSSGANWITQNSWIGTCIDWAWQTAGADVLSNSWGGGGSSALINDPITRSVTQGRGGLGAPVLFAAGNDNGTVSYPATLQNVISVVAMSMCNQRKSPTSCDGETFWGSNFGTNADVSAPGVKIYTTDISGSTGYSSGNYTATFNGTSSACPNAAGVMALILSVNPGLTNTQARQIIESTCDKVGGYTYTANVANQPNGTWSTDLGHGRVNAFAALQLANPQPCVNPPALSTALASPNAICGSGTVSLSLNGATFGTGQTYQWQSSPDNTTWTNVSGQTGQSASIPVSAATWFRCIVSCGSATPSTSVQVTINNPTINTFPHTQNFDASSSLPCGWTTQNVNADPNTWFVGSTLARSAPNNIAYSYNITQAGNDWIFTPPLNLVAGQNYRVRFWYRARSATYAEKLEVKWGASASAAGMTSAAIFSNTNIVNTTYAEGVSSNFVAATSGIQYIGFRVFSDVDKYDLYIDDITIETVSACTVPTVAGTISGPSAGTAGTNVSYSYSGGNGTAINWQSAIAGSFADISAATTNSLSLNLTPGTYQVRARISKSGCSDAFSNVINLTINPKVGDSFSLPIVIGSLPYSTSNSNAAGSGYSSTYTGTNQQASADVFYQFTTGNCVDSVVVSSCGSAFDTYIHLLSSTGTWIASNDDNGPSCTGTSGSLKASVLSNTTYYAVVEGYASTSGSFNLAISQLSNVGASATITANGPTTFCAGGSVTLTASAGSSYLWSNGATTQSTSVNASGNYSVTVTNANGCTSNASQGVTVNALPSVSISADGPTTFCAGGSVTLTASAGSSYAWSNGASTQSTSVNATGNYSVTVTDANGCSANASQGVTVNELPTVSISADGATTFCAGGSVNLTASAGSSYAWSNGVSTQSISVNASGNYSVTVSDANGCSANASQSITVNALPTVSISANGPTTFCAGGSVTLAASAGSSYAWSNGAATQSTSVNTTGNYSVTVTDANGCSANASQGVTVNELPSVSISADGATTFCAGGSVTLTASSGSSYAWSNGASTQSTSVNATGNYSVTVMDANGCSANASQGVTVNELPSVSISADGATTFCAGGSVTLTASAGSSYAWSNGATTQSTFVNASGNYSVTVTDANGCSANASLGVTVNGLPTVSISADGATTFCAGGSVTLTASAGSSYAWSNGATTQSTSVNATGSYSVTVTDANGCSANASQGVTVNDLPSVSISADGATTFCAGGSVILTASAGSSYSWSNGATTQSTSVNSTGNYSVTVTDANGCSANASLGVTVNALPSVSAGIYSSVTTLSNAVSLAGTPAGGTFTGTGVSGNLFNPSIAGVGTFTLTYNYTDGNGCSNSAQSSITVTPGCTLSAGTISGPTNSCAFQGTTGGNATYSVSAIDATSYTWTLPAGSTNITGQGTNTISFKFSSTYTTGTVSVVVGGCSTTASRSITVTRATPATPGVVSGTANVCSIRGTTQTNTYSIAPVANAISYLWVAPANTVIISGQGTTAITLQVNSAFTTGSITVRSNSGCANSTTRSFALSVSIPATPGTITGTSKACPGNTFTYTVAAVANASSYNWTVPTGATIVSGAGTNSIQVNFNAGFTATGSITVRAANGCGTSAARSYSVGRNTPATPSTIVGQASGICSATVNYSVTNVAGMTYTWTAPAGTSIASGQGTNAITLSVNPTFVSGTLSVNASNSCSTSANRTASLTARPATPASITGLATAVCIGSQQTYSVAALPGATSYTWTVPASYSIVSGQGTNSIVVNIGTANGSITARGNNACGSGSSRSLTVAVVSCARMAEESIESAVEFDVVVSPNPFNETLNIRTNGANNEKLQISIVDVSGRIVYNNVAIANETLNISPNLANGIYYVSVTNSADIRKLIKVVKAN